MIPSANRGFCLYAVPVRTRPKIFPIFQSNSDWPAKCLDFRLLDRVEQLNLGFGNQARWAHAQLHRATQIKLRQTASRSAFFLFEPFARKGFIVKRPRPY